MRSFFSNMKKFILLLFKWNFASRWFYNIIFPLLVLVCFDYLHGIHELFARSTYPFSFMYYLFPSILEKIFYETFELLHSISLPLKRQKFQKKILKTCHLISIFFLFKIKSFSMLFYTIPQKVWIRWLTKIVTTLSI